MNTLLQELLYILAIAAGAGSLLAPAAGMEHRTLPAALLVILFAGILTAMKNLSWTGRSVIGGLILALVLALWMLTRNDAIREKLAEYSDVLWLPVIGAGAFAAGLLICHLRPLRLTASCALIPLFIAAAAVRFPLDKLCVSSAFFLILLTAAGEIQRTWRKTGSTENGAHLVYVAPFLLVTILLTWASPAPAKPYDWAFVKAAIQHASEGLSRMKTRFTMGGLPDPAASTMGFSGRGTITGSVQDDPQEILTVSGIPSGSAFFKLSGRTFDTFDGREWTDTDDSAGSDMLLDTLSLLASVDGYTDTPTDLIWRSSLQIRYLGIRTDYAFTPLKALLTEKASQSGALRETGGDLRWAAKQSTDTAYEIPFYQMNIDHDVFGDYLQQATPLSGEAFERTAQRMRVQLGRSFTREDLARHREHILSVYTQEIALSDAVRQRMDEVYGDASDPRSRMKRLEAFLRGFAYTENPGALPRDIQSGEAFLDYFLTEKQAGFCSHFATAFVLLARADGLPARYVQGYILPESGDATVTVDSSMAHAWPEVWQEGVGWIAYEPTPGYEPRSWWRTAAETKAGYTEPVHDERSDRREEDPAEEEEEPVRRIVIPWYVVVIPLTVGLFFILLILLIGRLLAVRRFARMDARERFRVLCRRDLRLLALLDKGIGETETLREYRERPDLATEDTGFIELLETDLYGGTIDLLQAEREAADMKKMLLARLRKEHPLRFLRAAFLPTGRTPSP
ncbi:MAG: DUF3488 and transglutaminase-like domain-containing protein [Lachnospiraceae bacterium]|nr:DUF3488 and transglutaminase-like domain-containing protein [Lachnospiraceae bacterium]